MFLLLWSAAILGIMYFYKKKDMEIGKEYYNIDPRLSEIFDEQ